MSDITIRHAARQFWDKEGYPIELFDWAKKYGDWNYRIVKDEEFLSNNGSKCKVTTVWLGDNMEDELCGLDKEPNYKPRIFGTWIRSPDFDKELRHETHDLALLRHDAVVLAIKTGEDAALNKIFEECGV